MASKILKNGNTDGQPMQHDEHSDVLLVITTPCKDVLFTEYKLQLALNYKPAI